MAERVSFSATVRLTKDEALDAAAALLDVASDLRRLDRPAAAFALEGIESLLIERLQDAGPFD